MSIQEYRLFLSRLDRAELELQLTLLRLASEQSQRVLDYHSRVGSTPRERVMRRAILTSDEIRARLYLVDSVIESIK